MSAIKTIFFAFCLTLCVAAAAQTPTVKILESGKKVSIRGLSVVSDQVVWVSGTGGSVARSTNGGESFTWMKVPGYEKSDFRDIEAFDMNTAIIMGITTPAVILKTTDGGQTWFRVFEDSTKGAFFDAMDFSRPKNGWLVGDPVDSGFYLAQTIDYGETWNRFYLGGQAKNKPEWQVKEGEAFFASSGTNLKMLSYGLHFVMVSGGKSSRLFQGVYWDSIPIMQGKESTGANSIDIYNDKKGVIVGGDFSKDTISSNNCVLFDVDPFKRTKFTFPQTPPHGYRSCVMYLNKNTLLTCGTSGVDISNDGGMNWELIDKTGFHVCKKAKKGKTVFLAGGNGRIARLVYP